MCFDNVEHLIGTANGQSAHHTIVVRYYRYTFLFLFCFAGWVAVGLDCTNNSKLTDSFTLYVIVCCLKVERV